MKTKRIALVLASVCGGLTVSEAAVTIADLRDDYDNATHVDGINSTSAGIADSLGTGQWRFYASVTENPTAAGANLFDLEFDDSPNSSRSANAYTTRPSATFDLPGISNNKLVSTDVGTIGAGEMAVHPGNVVDGSPNDYLVVRWTAGAGATGVINLSGSIEDLESPAHPNINGVTFAVFDDSGAPLLASSVIAPETPTPFDIDTPVAGAGEDIWFVVGNNGNWTWDMSALSITIVPEPSSLLFLGLFGSAPLLLRRRRH